MTATRHSLLRRVLMALAALAVLAATACQSQLPAASSSVPLLPDNRLAAGDRLGLQVYASSSPLASSPAPSTVLTSANLRDDLFW